MRLPAISREKTALKGEMPSLEEAMELLWEDSSGDAERIKFWDEVW